MIYDHEVSPLAMLFKIKEPDVWREMGWMVSKLNQLPEEEAKDKMLDLITVVTVFIRKTDSKYNARDRVKIAVRMAELSCIDQEISPAYSFESEKLRCG